MLIPLDIRLNKLIHIACQEIRSVEAPSMKKQVVFSCNGSGDCKKGWFPNVIPALVGTDRIGYVVAEMCEKLVFASLFNDILLIVRFSSWSSHVLCVFPEVQVTPTGNSRNSNSFSLCPSWASTSGVQVRFGRSWIVAGHSCKINDFLMVFAGLLIIVRFPEAVF